MALMKPLTTENELSGAQAKHIENFWQTGVFSSFIGENKANIHFAKFLNPTFKYTIVISPGRCESYLKYKELCFDLYNQAYNVYVIDHRGQGLSSRLLANPKKGYVEAFDYYVEDLNTLIEQHVEQKPHILAHSMGASIALLLLIKYPTIAISAALSAPLIEINRGFIPHWLGKTIINVLLMFERISKNKPHYFIGQHKYHLKAFENNTQSQSPIRYQRYSELYKNTPTIQLGGVTTHWLQQVFALKKGIFSTIEKIKVPVLLMQSGREVIVSNQAQNELYYALKQHSKDITDIDLIKVDGAYHELFFERDIYRNKALTKALNWFKKYQ